MQAIRIHRVVTDDRIEEIKQFIGKKVEIIILPEDNEEEAKDNSEDAGIFSLKGKIKRKIDGVEYQRKIREEWDHRL